MKNRSFKKAPLYLADNPLWRSRGRFRSNNSISRLRLYAVLGGALILWTAFWLTLAYNDAQSANTESTHNAAEGLNYEKDVRVITKQVMGRITYYGWTGNKMANGQYPKDGAVATSDRTIPLGTKVMISGKEYVVSDRTAKWVHEKFKYPTFDIYSVYPEKSLREMGTHNSLVSFIK